MDSPCHEGFYLQLDYKLTCSNENQSQRSETSLRNFIGRPSNEKISRACSDILSDALNVRPHKSQQPSFTALSSRAIFMFL